MKTGASRNEELDWLGMPVLLLGLKGNEHRTGSDAMGLQGKTEWRATVNTNKRTYNELN